MTASSRQIPIATNSHLLSPMKLANRNRHDCEGIAACMISIGVTAIVNNRAPEAAIAHHDVIRPSHHAIATPSAQAIAIVQASA